MRVADFMNAMNNQNTYTVKETTVQKNGIDLRAFQITKAGDNVGVVFYESTLEQIADDQELVSAIENALNHAPVVDNSFFTREFVMNNVRLTLQKIVEDCEYVTFPFLDMVYIPTVFLPDGFIDGAGTIKLTDGHLRALDISQDELLEQAKTNTIFNTTVMDMKEKMRGMLPDEMIDEMPDSGMYIVSNHEQVKGSGALCEELLETFCDSKGLSSVTILPSSIHEFLVVTTPISKKEADAMVKEVNDTQVSEFERLVDHAFTYNANDGVICY